METKKDPFNVEKLVKAFRSGSLSVNPEYQRGATWKLHQKQALIDSIFRGYPIPPLFLNVIQDEGLRDEPIERFEIVDGQQRLVALRDYMESKWPLLESTDKRLKLPTSLRGLAAPWAGKYYKDLSPDHQRTFTAKELDVFLVTVSSHADEVRDLFIRLQSGTALSRQQIRDAWPGDLGPYVESLAGKLSRRPSRRLFSLVDQRGQRSEDDEERDPYVTDRQTCAQLLCVFIARERDPNNYPSISADALDALYHENTQWAHDGPTAKRFEDALGYAEVVFDEARKGAKRNKFRRLLVLSVMMFFQDLSRNEHFKLSPPGLRKLGRELAQHMKEFDDAFKGIKVRAGSTIESYYGAWRKRFDTEIVGLRLDPQRNFDDQQKALIRERDKGKCGRCEQEVTAEEAEYDHFPVPYRDGGKTVVENARLVHKTCHPRGRPAAPSDDDD